MKTDKMLFKELYKEVFETFYIEGKSERVITIAGNELVSLIGNVNINLIDHLFIRDKVLRPLQKKGNAPATINRKLALLSKCLTYAYNVRYIDHKPSMPNLKVDNSKVRYITEEEQQVIYDYFSKHYSILADLLIFGVNTGMRISEILKLEPDEIDGDYIRIWKSKNKRARSVPINAKVRVVIDKYPDHLFSNLTYRIVNSHWKRMQLATGYNDISINTMRHTFCSRLIQKEVRLYIIQRLAGHTTLEGTQRYAHLSDKNLIDAVALL